VFGIQSDFLLQLDPKCMLCYHLQPCTCGLEIEGPTQQHLHNLYDCWVS
jgi:hypothetical protein